MYKENGNVKVGGGTMIVIGRQVTMSWMPV